MKILLIHHLEPCWESGYKKIGNTSFEELSERFAEHLDNETYDRVILTRFELPRYPLDDYDPCFASRIDVVEEYGYGWEMGMLPDGEWCEGGTHSEIVYLPDWVRELKGDTVYLAGAFDGECIEDMEIALREVGANIKRVEELIV